MAEEEQNLSAACTDLSSAEPITIIRLGLGKVVVGTGTNHGIPAVFIEPTPTSGLLGERAPQGDLNSVAPGGIIIELHGDPSVLIEALIKARAAIAQATGEGR